MIIRDPVINLDGFLCGTAAYPMRWSQLAFEATLSRKESLTIEQFQRRAQEFLLNVEDLRLPSCWGIGVDAAPTRARVSSSGYPGKHRAKSLYLDFRHFVADKEPARFQRTVNIIRKRVDKQHPVQHFLAEVTDGFVRYGAARAVVEHLDVNVAELINIWFNTQLFHSGNIKQTERRKELLQVLEEDGVEQLLFWAVINAAHPIKCLYACVKDIGVETPFTINYPDVRLIYRNHRAIGA